MSGDAYGMDCPKDAIGFHFQDSFLMMAEIIFYVNFYSPGNTTWLKELCSQKLNASSVNCCP